MVTSAAECPQSPPCISARLLYFIPIILWRQDKLSGPNFLSDMLQLSLMLRNLIKDSREHFDCTKAEALDALRKNGADLATFVAGLSDDELDRKGSMPAFGGEVTVNQVIDFVIFQSAQEHFDSMKTAVGR